MGKKNKRRNPEVKTKKHLTKEKKKAAKEEVRRELLNVKTNLTTEEKAKVDPFQPIAPTRCNRCGDGFADISGARSHRAAEHLDCKFFCRKSLGKKPTCGCVFPNQNHLKTHDDYHKRGILAAAAAVEEVEGEDSDDEELFMEVEKLNCHMM